MNAAAISIRDAQRIASGDMTEDERAAYALGGSFFRTATPADRRVSLCDANPYSTNSQRLAWAAGFSDALRGRAATRKQEV